MPFILKEFPIPTPMKAYRFLMQHLHLDMAQSQKYINKGRVIYKGKPLNNNQKSKILEQSVSVIVFEADSLGLKPLYENEDFALFNKPAKMLIHPKGRFTHHSLIDEIRSLYGEEASLAHRIDKETSGLVIVGKHKKSVAELGEMFTNNQVSKEYLALVKGDFSKSRFGGREFCLSLPLAIQPKGGDLCVRSKFLGQNGAKPLKFKEAKSEFEVLGLLMQEKRLEISQNSPNTLPTISQVIPKPQTQPKRYTLLKVRPKTGRTHQIRLHLYALGFAILGDPLYGAEDKYSREYLDEEFIAQEQNSASNPKTFGLSDEKRLVYFGATRLMLHAYGLNFTFKGKHYRFESSQNFEIKL